MNDFLQSEHGGQGDTWYRNSVSSGNSLSYRSPESRVNIFFKDVRSKTFFSHTPFVLNTKDNKQIQKIDHQNSPFRLSLSGLSAQYHFAS